MEIKTLLKQVNTTAGIAVQAAEIQGSTWTKIISEATSLAEGVFQWKDKYIWLWKQTSTSVTVLEAVVNELAPTEAKLIALLIASAQGERKAGGVKKDDESRSIQLGEWLQEQIDNLNLSSVVPEAVALKSQLQSPLLPFLLRWENRTGQAVTYSKLYKLLRSYYGGACLLLPLREAWLILVSESLLNSLREDSEEGMDTEHEFLSALCQGLYELISNEWVGGGFQLTVHELISGEAQLVQASLEMQEILNIGRLFHVTEQIYLPWELQLEEVLYGIPQESRERFLARKGRLRDILADEEVLLTLETFLEMDCNISETAKRLYIHRNTLMYRIDKIKQETGLDVRAFRDAVLMRLLLLLYKMTK